MSLPPESSPNEANAGPVWLLPVIIVGAIILVAGLVTLTLTLRNAPSPSSSANGTAVALPTGHPTLDPARDSTALPSAHGGVDPDGPPVEMISLTDARAYQEAGTAIFIDIRPGSDYNAAHIPGALSLTATDLQTQMAALPTETRFIAYGDATRPESSQRAAQIFLDLGYPQVSALEGGFQDWVQAGYPVEP
ncbi:rhodanese-like domain-containing protein [Candidatus Oscillochloris fontis]|uniref:rhodanese-like domain-containing protein n=1 Tax=Candidatus Oscillochloris fontis TaxID=2496868 RepID=UPI00101CBDC5|nr:rhodanese-like domain-containing protein [Candidatus Oscillochloris fontis]